ncbi:autotransporter domain-containing protein [Methylobacterium sp. NEAU 140]|uniref:autotransporter domain-containing protein n=1 Tax=Methylobacterium sp. NEAU 140 TaxID=3064945 RepID=UPI002736A149|nr:autotransporter domain-containing protein [Methylobacterium sp. NEAU 140]MDP4023449.1 autotransporter domain-containing protein [Methylobacterium sp. NEAU 140]
MITRSKRPRSGGIALLCLTAAAAAASSGAAAQGVSSMTVFGDSYADTGNVVRLTGQPLPFPYVNGRFSNGANFIDGLQAIYVLPPAAVANYAVGGAQTGATNVDPGLPGLSQEVAAFQASGRRFGPGDLVVINIGGNDGIRPTIGGLTAAQAPLLGQSSAVNAVANVAQLIGAGARTIAFNGFTALSTLPAVAASGNGAAGDVFARTYFNGLQAGLAPYAYAGTRIFLLDSAVLQQRIAANPGLYGFVNVTTPCALVPSCIGAPRAVQNTYLSYDGVHLTEGGYLYLARYIANALAAPNGIAAQAELGQIGTTSFAASLLQRLDAMRHFAPGPLGAPAAIGASGVAPLGAAASPVIVWSQGSYAGGRSATRGYATGYEYDSPGGTLGIEATPQPGIRFGLAFNYVNPHATLKGGAGYVDVDSYQFAAYGSYTGTNLFADGALVYGRHAYAMDRPGVVDRITATTGGDAVVLSGKAGYLFDAWNGWRFGPIAGLTYATTHVAGYTERGDAVLTQAVRDTGFDSLIGRAGAQIRSAPLAVGGAAVTGFVNLTAERQFFDGARTLVTSLTTTPLLPILTPLGRASRAAYGQFEAGLRADVSSLLTATLTGGTTFSRTGGDAFLVSGGLTLRFW